MGLPLADLEPLLLRGHQLASRDRTEEAIEVYGRARTLAESSSLQGIVELADTGLAATSAASA